MRALLSNRVMALVALVAVVGATVAEARTAPNRPRRPRATNLFAGANLLFGVNRVLCNLTSTGEVCSAGSSPVGGGGFWPNGTPDQYIFNSGLQIGGLVDPNAGFAWAGDTVGTYFFDASGGQEAGEAIFGVHYSLDPADAAAWPNGAVARDADIYAPGLLGLNQVSQGDAWTRYWEGNPDRGTGRPHPLGIVVDQRVLAYGFPAGNEDILYITFTFYNVTATAASGAYNNPTIPPELQAEIGALGDRFQAVNEAKFGAGLIPDGGYTITDAYVAFAMDADVAIFSHNYATAILPYNLGITYSGDFLPEVGWQFPADIFGAPFYPGAGFVGVKFLKSPKDGSGNEVGLTMFSQHFNPNQGSGLLDPEGGNQLYRYISGHFGVTDAACSPFTDRAVALERRLCYLGQTQGDARFYQGSGPFTLAPGEAQTIVVAYVHAAPLNIVAPYVGGDVLPGIPFTGDSIFADTTKIRLIDRIAGWVTQSDNDGNQVITQEEIVTEPRSLLDKSIVAQNVFDVGFVAPFAPEAPQFFLVPGNNTVTVVWQPSRTETPAGGDPYFGVASDPTGALYDPNYRQFDVEGYRIYRGRSSAELTLIAQYDYSGTALIDYVGAVSYGDENGDGLVQCAPELGLLVDCPADLATGHAVPLVGNVIQVDIGQRTQLAGSDTTVYVMDSTGTVIDSTIVYKAGSVINLVADTLVTGGVPKCVSRCPALNDAGVPFAYTDNGVRNSFSYVYAVTSFDANSIRSGPTTLESPRVTKIVTPRADGGQEGAGNLAAMQLLGADGSTLAGTMPTIDAATGKFSGPMPPSDGFTAGLSAFLPQVLGDGALTVTIDSVQTGMVELDVAPGSFEPTLYYMTGQGAGAPSSFVVSLAVPNNDGADQSASATFKATNIDDDKAGRFGGDSSFALYGAVSVTSPNSWLLTSWSRADINGAPANSSFNGPRWWAGAANEDTDDPTGGMCLGSPGNCGSGVPVNLNRTAGAIAGVEIFHPASYGTTPNSPGRIIEGIFATVTRAADFAVYWGAAGVVDSVIDLTHKVPVPFKSTIGASWGILNQASFAGTTQALTRDANNALLTWSDMYCVGPAPVFIGAANGCGGGAQVPAVLQSTAALSPIAFATSSYAGTAALTATGNGFIFYMAGHYFLIQTATLPSSTVWFARYYAGTITGSAGGGDFAFTPATRPPAVPGLRAQVTYQGGAYDTTTTVSLDNVHTVPDPYYVTNSLEITANQKFLNFVNLPSQAIIRIYSVSGVLVQVLSHSDNTDGGEATWNLRNRNNQFVASGVYFYHVETPTGQTKVGRFTVVNFAP
jgi:hypothetical protein